MKPAFDATNLRRTCEWMATEAGSVLKTPDGNEFAQRDAVERLTAKFRRAMVGKKVSWLHELGSVDTEGFAQIPAFSVQGIPGATARLDPIRCKFEIPDKSWAKKVKFRDPIVIHCEVMDVGVTTRPIQFIISVVNATVGPVK